GLERARPRGRRDAGRGCRRARPALRGARPRMTFLALFWLNVGLLALFAVLVQREGLLCFAKGGKWYLTWFATGLITLMDELTSIFYVPAEAHRFIGTRAIFFIAITSLLMRVLSTRMVEIAQILELHDLRGGGVYSFSYFVLGPVASFVAVASIMVDYILTACISTVSAAYNGAAFLPLAPAAQDVIIFAGGWAVAGRRGAACRAQTAGGARAGGERAGGERCRGLPVGSVAAGGPAHALSAPLDFAAHEEDLIPRWAAVVGDVPFGVLLGVAGSLLLIVAV